MCWYLHLFCCFKISWNGGDTAAVPKAVKAGVILLPKTFNPFVPQHKCIEAKKYHKVKAQTP
jgi:hypothetical protein